MDAIGASAIRSLSVDVANLSARMAVQTATLEQIMQIAAPIDASTWTEMESPVEETTVLVAIPADHARQLQALLSTIAAMQ